MCVCVGKGGHVGYVSPCLRLPGCHCCKKNRKKKAKRIMLLCLKQILRVGFKAVTRPRHCGRMEFASRTENSPHPPLPRRLRTTGVSLLMASSLACRAIAAVALALPNPSPPTLKKKKPLHGKIFGQFLFQAKTPVALMPESSSPFDVPLTHAHVYPPQHNAFGEIKRLQCMTHFAEAGFSFSFFSFTFITTGARGGGRGAFAKRAIVRRG